MSFFVHAIDVILHLDRHLGEWIQHYGIWIYGILFLIILLETGLVVTPFLPGDSLLFAVGTFAASGALDFWTVVGLLIVAAILGDTMNYGIGWWIGPKAFHFEKSRFFNPKHLKKTHALYEKYGGRIIILARFMPIVRTFAPFVAGIGRMSYRSFLAFNIVGGVVWITSLTALGFWFGNLLWVKKNFTFVILAIIIISFLPLAWEAFEEVRKMRAEKRKS